MTKIQNPKRVSNLNIRILNLFRISNFEFRIFGQRGVSIYLALAITAILLSSTLGVSVIFVNQVRILKEIGNSVVAFYAADVGIEKILLKRQIPSDIPETFLPNGASYKVVVIAGGSCGVPNFCIRSIGTYREIRRAIEITY